MPFRYPNNIPASSNFRSTKETHKIVRKWIQSRAIIQIHPHNQQTEQKLQIHWTKLFPQSSWEQETCMRKSYCERANWENSWTAIQVFDVGMVLCKVIAIECCGVLECCTNSNGFFNWIVSSCWTGPKNTLRPLSPPVNIRAPHIVWPSIFVRYSFSTLNTLRTQYIRCDEHCSRCALVLQ